MTEQAGDGFYEQLVAEYDAFFCRFPAYPGTDELDVLLGHLHTKKEKYLTALTYYQKVLSTCPNSQFRSSAQRLIGDLYVTGLKDVNEAVNAYQDVINQYPNSEDAAYAYEQTARLEEQQTHFELAVDIYEKIVKVYPNKPVAARAFNGEARILNEQLKKPDEALAVYGRLADMFKGSEDAETALKTAAALARKQKNFNAEVSQYVRIARECATAKDAPDMLYQAAQIAEDDLTQNNRAVELYKELTEKFPDSKLAKKASGRIKALLGK